MLLMRLLFKMLAIIGICLVLQIVPASADTVTLQVNASFTLGTETDFPGINTLNYSEPLFFATGQIFLDTDTVFWSKFDQPQPNGVLGIDLTLTGPNGTQHDISGGSGNCRLFEAVGPPPAYTCVFTGPGFFFQSYLFVDPFSVGQSAQICGAEFTRYPDGALIFGSSGVCAGTSDVNFLGELASTYSLRDGSSSGRLTVTAISTPEPGILPLLATGLVALVGLKLRRRTASRCVIS